MRAFALRIFLIFTLIGTVSICSAEKTPGDLWLSGYSKYMEGIEMEKADKNAMALGLFQSAASDMKKVKADYPDWQADLVTFRLEKCNRKIDVLNNMLAEKQNELSKDDLITLNQNLRSTVADLEQQVAAALEKVEAAKSVTPVAPVAPPAQAAPTVTGNEGDSAKYKDENTSLKAKIDVLEDQVTARDKALKQANNEIAKARKLQKEITKLKKVASSLEEDLTTMVNEKAAIRNELSQLRDERGAMAGKLKKLTKEVNDLQTDSALLRQQNEALRKQVK